MSLHEPVKMPSIAELDAAEDRDLARLDRAHKPLRTEKPDADPAPQLRIVDLSALDARPATFALHPVAPRRTVTLLAAPGGVGKTTLALAWCACVAVGRAFGPYIVEAPARAVFVTLEDEGGQIALTLASVCDALNLDASAVAANFTLIDGAIEDVSLAREVGTAGARMLQADPALDQLAEIAQGAALVVVDGVGDALRGNLSDSVIVRDFIRRKLIPLARSANCAIVLIGHLDKAASRHGAAGQSYLGSVEWNNAARSRVAVTERDGALWLDHEKGNWSRKAEPLRLRRHASGALLPDDASAGSESTAQTDADALLAAIQTALAAEVNIPTARTGPATAQHVLATFGELPEAMRGTKGRARFWAALEKLRAAGCVSSQRYQNEHRHKRTRWVTP